MKKNKGFTLIELLAVIVILAIIALISTPIIIGLIDNARKETFKDSAYGIIKAGELLYTQDLLDETNEEVTFTYTDGVESSSVSGKELNYNGLKPQNGQVKVNGEGQVAIAIHNGNYCAEKGYYESEIILSDEEEGECNIPLYADNSGASIPELTTGMIPVKWDGTNWIKADPTDRWYDYDTKEWANAVTVTNTNRATHLSAEVGSIIPMSDINTMWVWIPRYAYQIATNYHTNTAGTINIKFLKNDTNTASDGTTPIATTPTYSGSNQTNYIKHPAFTFGSKELTGLWVAKFEASGAIAQIDFIPNVSQLSSVSVGNMFTSVRNMEKTDRYGWNQESGTLNSDGTFTTTNNNMDTHMMKNTEWGAVAYLSHSIYGINSEIFTNPSFGITGRGGETVSQDGTADTTDIASPTLYGYDGKSCLSKIGNICTGVTNEIYGTASSTTGTIYGIYGISSQGTYEYVMGNYNNTAGSSGLTPANINNKYIDRYTGYNNTVFGDAVWETSLSASSPYENSWYGDYSAMINASRPWVWRGGGFGTRAGAFFFYSFDGSANVGSFRTTLVVGEGL